MPNQWNPGIDYHGDRYIYGAGQAISDDLRKALANFHEQEQQRRFNTELFKGVGEDAVRRGYIPVEALNKFASMKDAEQAGTLATIARKTSEDVQQQHQQMEEQRATAQIAEANARANLLWAQGQRAWTGEDEDAAFRPSEEEITAGKASGKTPVHTTKNSVQWIDIPETQLPDLDPDGNPIFSTDGTMYKSGGKFKPVTGPMLQAHIISEAKKKADRVPQQAPAGGFSVFKPSTWGTGSPKPDTTGKVRVKNPQGDVGWIPAEQLQKALANGYQQMQ